MNWNLLRTGKISIWSPCSLGTILGGGHSKTLIAINLINVVFQGTCNQGIRAAGEEEES